jgi:multidrug resistance efflux pump
MLASWVRYLVAASGLLFVVPSFSFGDGPEEKSAWRLKREVEERERQLTRVQRELAEARARLALAEGKREVAITELRKAVACCQGEVQWIRDHANWFCDPREPMDEAQWDLAKDCVWLAEVEGDTAALVAEWKKIVGFHEQRLKRVQRLEQTGAANPADVSDVQQALDKARQHLEAVEKRLSAERAKSPDASK